MDTCSSIITPGPIFFPATNLILLSGVGSGVASHIFLFTPDQTPDSPEVWRGLGEALTAAGYEDRAAQCRKRANQIESDTNAQSEPEISTGTHDDVDEEELLLIAADEVRLAPVVEERGSL